MLLAPVCSDRNEELAANWLFEGAQGGGAMEEGEDGDF
jgi:hypothetical protein